MFETYRRLQRQRAAGEIDGGFTLIELLIVIVVLGILAAIVVFALGSVTGKSAAAACQSDAKTVGIGVAALTAENPVLATSGILTSTTFQADMTATGTVTYTSGGTTNNVIGNPFVQTWPSSSSYTISISSGSTDGGAAPNNAKSENNSANPLSATTPGATVYQAPYGDVLVTGKGSGVKGMTYDATVDPIEACNWAVTGAF